MNRQLSDADLIRVFLDAAGRRPGDRLELAGLRAVATAARGLCGSETGQELYDRVERQYWAQHPEATPTDIAVGETVKIPALAAGGVVVQQGGLFPVTGVRDEGRTIDVKIDRSFTRTLLTHQVQRNYR